MLFHLQSCVPFAALSVSEVVAGGAAPISLSLSCALKETAQENPFQFHHIPLTTVNLTSVMIEKVF